MGAGRHDEEDHCRDDAKLRCLAWVGHWHGTGGCLHLGAVAYYNLALALIDGEGFLL